MWVNGINLQTWRFNRLVGKVQEKYIFHGKIHGFRLRCSRLHQSVDHWNWEKMSGSSQANHRRNPIGHCWDVMILDLAQTMKGAPRPRPSKIPITLWKSVLFNPFQLPFWSTFWPSEFIATKKKMIYHRKIEQLLLKKKNWKLFQERFVSDWIFIIGSERTTWHDPPRGLPRRCHRLGHRRACNEATMTQNGAFLADDLANMAIFSMAMLDYQRDFRVCERLEFINLSLLVIVRW